MCGRYTLTRQERAAEALEAIVGAEVTAQGDWWKPRWNVAPTQPAPVVVLRDDVRTLELMRWGLVPFWGTQPGAKPPLMINARVENLHAKAVFRDALATKRCLVPADGFFEWRRDDHAASKGAKTTKKSRSRTPPQPIYFRPASGQIFAFAGLWARARSDSGAELLSFTIITGPPNELVAPIHDRMPLVLSADAHAAWLDPTVAADEARALLKTPPVDDWQAGEVSTHVNNANHDDPACIEPPPAPLPVQGKLFG